MSRNTHRYCTAETKQKTVIYSASCKTREAEHVGSPLLSQYSNLGECYIESTKTLLFTHNRAANTQRHAHAVQSNQAQVQGTTVTSATLTHQLPNTACTLLLSYAARLMLIGVATSQGYTRAPLLRSLLRTLPHLLRMKP